jgi:hypothetical protein
MIIATYALDDFKNKAAAFAESCATFDHRGGRFMPKKSKIFFV